MLISKDKSLGNLIRINQHCIAFGYKFCLECVPACLPASLGNGMIVVQSLYNNPGERKEREKAIHLHMEKRQLHPLRI